MTYRQAKLPDGSEIRIYHAGAIVSPSVSVVAYRVVGSTNWTLPNTFSGQGLVGAASTGGGIAAAGALLRPSRSDFTSASGNDINTIQTVIAPRPSKPMPMRSPKHSQD